MPERRVTIGILTDLTKRLVAQASACGPASESGQPRPMGLFTAATVVFGD
jgi:hypothetical protein